jgi:prepilin-type N-terminal cleavage/methylation domain-containing protein
MRSSDGFTLVELLVVVLITGVLIALLSPNFVLMQERARRTAVKEVMRTVNLAIQAYAADNGGAYPQMLTFGGDYLDNPSPPHTDIILWFPGGDPIGMDGSPIPGVMPVNPYTGRRYNSYDEDMDGSSYFGELEPGQHAQCETNDPDCPYADFAAPNGLQGTVCVASYAPEEAAVEKMEQYGIFGFGRDVTLPMFDFTAGDSTGEPNFRFFVLHN